jgi:hypothetical protein
MTRPNFFILGAPKCGTTSLAHWLTQHPNVFMSPVKEPHHYSSDLSIGGWEDPTSYRSLFDLVEKFHHAVGEASVWYLHSREAVPRIEAELGKPRYIVMLRNPVQMAPSLHHQVAFSDDEDVAEFAAAWRLQGARENGESIPKRCRDPKLVQYRKACRLGEQLERLYQTVERGRVLVVFLEDIQSDVSAEWARILEFLELPQWNEIDFATENRSKHWRWPWVRDLKRFYANIQRRFELPPLGWGIFKHLRKVSIQESPRKPLSEELHTELIDAFRDDIELLSQLTERDLRHWLK